MSCLLVKNWASVWLKWSGFFLTLMPPTVQLVNAEQVSSVDWATAGEGYSAFSFFISGRLACAFHPNVQGQP
jgi:hypothetical protein